MTKRPILAVLLGLALGVLLSQFAVTLMRVDGVSMQPTLQDRNVVVVLRPQLHRLLEALGAARAASAEGTVLVLLDPLTAPQRSGTAWRDFLERVREPLLVKRVVAGPGETVAYRDGERFLDGSPAPEPWLPPDERGHFRTDATRVGVGEVFVLGDDRLPLASRDSRTFGPVSLASVRGQVVARLRWPRQDGTWLWPFAAVR
ncbi:MAG: signal peptidase I [Trueperaceae bacterium]|nr:signal peptidase I [Truepera sp.]